MTERFDGRYVLLRPIGSGGMGDVFLALDRATRGECALKRLRPEVLAVSAETLGREFAVLGAMRHPLIVQVFDFGVARDGTPFYTMEYVPGVPANAAVTAGNWDQVAWVGVQMTGGLEALHSQGTFHGDLKPSNVLVIPSQAPGAPVGLRLVDFGLAGLVGRGGRGHCGTPGYAAPEVARGEPPSAKADLFGLGATLFALGTGQCVPSPDRVAGDLAEAGAPPELAHLILCLLAPNPWERPAAARDIRLELERVAPAARRPLSERLRLETVVGRERELAHLGRWLALAPSGARITVLAAEEGMGKSALLEAVAVRAELAGHRVCRLTSDLFESEADATALLSALEAQTGVRTRSAEDGPDMSCAPEVESGRRWWPPGEGVLVLVDGAERLDSASRLVLRSLALRPELGGLRWIWSFATQLDGIPEEEQFLVASGEAQLLLLPPLERGAADRLVASRLQEQPPGGLCQASWEKAGGHPGLLIELLRIAIERGALLEREGELRLDATKLASLDLPDSLEAAGLARLSSLSATGVSLARAMAILARPARAEEILAVGEVADSGALTEVARSGLGHCDAHGLWSLSPPGLADPIRRKTPQETRVALHARALALSGLSAGERFEHYRGAGLDRQALADAEASLAEAADEELVLRATELARQAAPDTAPRWQELAARILIERGRHLAAIPHLESALQSRHGAPDRPTLWHLLAVALIRTGRPAKVREVIAQARAEGVSARIEGLLCCSEAAALLAEGAMAEATAAAERALRIGRETDDPGLLGHAALSRGGIALALGNMGEAVTLGQEAETAFARAGQGVGRIRALGLQGAALAAQDPGRAGQLFTEAIDEARRRGWRMAAGELLVNWAQIQLQTGHWQAARESHAEAYRLALEDGRARMGALVLANLVHDDGLTGELRRGARLARAAVHLVPEACPAIEPFLWRTISRLHRVSGRLRVARRALARARRGASGPEGLWCELEAALQLARLGRWPAVGRRCTEALGRPGQIEPLVRVLLTALAGRAELRTGEAERAGERLRVCEGLMAGRAAPYFAAHVTLLAAERELASGRIPGGVQLAAGALTVLSELPAPAERAAAIIDFVSLVPEPETLPGRVAEGWLSDAIETCARLGDRALGARALALEVKRLRRMDRLPDRPTGDLLRSVGKLLASLADLSELTRQAMALAVEQLGAERGVLLLTESGALVPVVEYGVLDPESRERALGYSRRAVERVARSGGSLLVADAPSDPEAQSESVIDLGLRSILCVPLYGAGQVIGAVYLDDSRRAEVFSQADRKLLEGFAELVALAIEKSRGHEEIRRENELLVGENLSLRRRVGMRFQRENFIAMSAAMQEVLAVVERAAQVSSTILITGENGTGKELVARILHHSGKRSEKPFVVVNCGAIPASLLESELFGILPNVATGVRGRDGRFLEANGGTLFLDEVGDMPLPQQVALLSVIATREVTPVGGGHPIKVDVRIIAATNRDLARRVQEDAFREDLYYRLNVIPIEIPPLRKRKADVPVLAHHFAANFAAQQEREVPEFSSEFLAALMQSDWPGNVRELQNYIERVMAMTPGRVLHPKPLPHDLQGRSPRLPSEAGRPLHELIEELERRQIEKALARCRGIQSRAAQELDLSEQALRYRIRKYGLPDFRRFRQIRRKPR